MESDTTGEMLKDLLWLNAVIATELMQITENSSALLRKSPPPESCIGEHGEMRRIALAIAEKYRNEEIFRKHLTGHQ
jgi:hypothetical protein